MQCQGKDEARDALTGSVPTKVDSTQTALDEQLQSPLRELASEAVLIDRGPRFTRGLRDSLELLCNRRPALPAGAGLTSPADAPSNRRLLLEADALTSTATRPARDHGVGLGWKQLHNGLSSRNALDGLSFRESAGLARSEGDPKLGLVFDPEDPFIQRDILRMVRQYLEDHGYTLSSMVLNDEANLMEREARSQQWQARRIRSAILAGDWPEVERLCQKTPLKNLKVFLYALYRQQFLELIERHETEKAYVVLMKRLKPLEGHAPRGPAELRDLCYLLTCKSVHEAHAAAIPLSLDWGGSQAGRELLAEQLTRLMDVEQDAELFFGSPEAGAQRRQVPPRRLERLLQQAFAYQVEFARYHPLVLPRIRTLLEDYYCFAIPNAERAPRLCGHEANLKCVSFVGREGLLLATGSSDRRIGIWDTDSGTLLHMLTGHTSRVWDLSASPSGRILASGSADGRVGVWVSDAHAASFRLASMLAHHSGSLSQSTGSSSGTLSLAGARTIAGLAPAVTSSGGQLPAGGGDVYTVSMHPAETHVLSGGYDKTLQLHDIRTGQVVRTFIGHQAAVTQAVFNPYGNLIVSGSKDSTIKFWDIASGVCVRTFSFHFGEVTSVELNSSGTMLLSSSKDNSNRLWDLRASRPIRRLKGHQNTSKNFIRASFGPNELLVVGGSEDGYIYIWDVESAALIQKLAACRRGPVFSAIWSQQQSLLASCGNDGDARLWWYDPSRPLTAPDALIT
jgi:WD40 repeat protein